MSMELIPRVVKSVFYLQFVSSYKVLITLIKNIPLGYRARVLVCLCGCLVYFDKGNAGADLPSAYSEVVLSFVATRGHMTT